jgi:hypothetical protein
MLRKWYSMVFGLRNRAAAVSTMAAPAAGHVSPAAGVHPGPFGQLNRP